MIGELRTVGATVSRTTIHFQFVGGEAINLRRDAQDYYRKIGEWFCGEFGAGPVQEAPGKELVLADVEPDIVRDILLLVMDHPPTIEIIEGWTIGEKNRAIDWASSVHLRASDNDDIEVPGKPEVLVTWEESRGTR